MAEGGRTRKLARAVVRDSKGWRIDRRRSVIRYSCQQAAGIASPFPFRFHHPCAPPSLARQPSRTLRYYGCRVTQEYSPRKCSIDVFSATRPLDGILRARSLPFPFLPNPPRVPFPAYRAPFFHAPSAFYSAILEYCSCYTVAGTDRGQLLDIPRETVLVHRP